MGGESWLAIGGPLGADHPPRPCHEAEIFWTPGTDHVPFDRIDFLACGLMAGLMLFLAIAM
jgi:hypothetical protein